MAELSLLIHTDGASRGNPGAAAFAFVIATEDETLVEDAGCLGRLTNNQAEYTALIRALESALELRDQGQHGPVIVHSDSELMVKQIKGEYRVKNPELQDLYQQALQLYRKFPKIELQHVRREQNRRADVLCNEALDGKRQALPRKADFAPNSASTRQVSAIDGVAGIVSATTVTNTKNKSGKTTASVKPNSKTTAPKTNDQHTDVDLHTDALEKIQAILAEGPASQLWDQLVEVLRRHGMELPPRSR